MKIWFYIGVWCVVAGLSSAAVASSLLPNEAKTQKGSRADFFVPALCTNTNRQVVMNELPNLRITTLSKVIGGMPDTETPQTKIRLEFAIAPMKGNVPLLDEALIVSSNENGEFEVYLSPGRYWIGPKEKALNPDGYDPGGSEIQQMIVEVEADGMTRVKLLKIDYAP